MHDRPAAFGGKVSGQRLERAIEDAAPALLGYFVRRVDVVEDAADLVSETMISAWKASRRMPRDPQEARMWLFGVARNVLRHHVRSSSRRDALVARLGQAVSAAQPPDDDISLDVRAAVEELPEPLAELIRLVHWDGFSLEDAAAHLRIPASTARGRHSRARQLLQESLASVHR
ncbi:RNA polymerase sigma factor [Homoserinimonas sp. A447]